MTSTISGTHTSGITLGTGTYANPVYVTGTIDVASGVALLGPSGTAWTTTNDGLIRSRGTARFAHNYGVSLASGGEIINQASATIFGFYGADIAGAAGTVINAGTIGGGTSGYAGVVLGDGGTVVNQAGGLLTGYKHGVDVANAAGTVINAGSIGIPSIFGSQPSGVALYAGGAVTNQAGGTISGAVGVTLGGSGDVTNAGMITGVARAGVRLSAGGSVTNQSGGTISGGFGGGVAFYNVTGTVTNAGELTSTIDGGVYLHAGGSVTNQSGGTISSGGSVAAAVGFGAAGTVDNAGTISGSDGAVSFASGFTNVLIARPSAVFSGKVDGGNTIGATAVSTLELGSGASAGKLSGLGTQFVDFGLVAVDAGAIWSLSGQTIANGVTLTNSGTVGDGVYLAAGASLTNAEDGVINAGTASYAVYGTSAATMLNYGSIVGTANGAIYLANGGLLSNASGGVISGYQIGIDLEGASADTVINASTIIATENFGIQVNASYSQITNRSGGLISGASFGVIGPAEISIANAGSINSGYSGVLLRGGGLVVNQSGGTITGTHNGIDGHYGVDTIINAGSVGGGTIAVRFGTYDGNRLIVDPSATFSGVVDGGNTVGSTAVSTLELASGSSVGRLHGLGTSIVHFADVTIDAGAVWTLNSAALPGGYSIIDSGTLTNPGSLGSSVTVASGGVLSNASGGTVAVTGTAVAGASGATVVNAGHIAGNGSGNDGVALGNNSLLVNQVGGSIYGGFTGVFTSVAPNTTIHNYGSINGAIGVLMQNGGGGSLTNAAGGTISSAGYGIVVNGGAGTVVNAGSITGHYAIRFRGTSVPFLDNLAGGRITGSYGVQFTENSFGTIDNAGSIGGTTNGIDLASGGGTVTNQSGGRVSGNYGVVFSNVATTLDNAGSIYGSRSGVLLQHGGFVTNRSGGTISAPNNVGVYATSGVGTVDNSGEITASVGVDFTDAGLLLNESGGTISGTSQGVQDGSTPMTVSNAGSIYGALHGLYLQSGGVVTNQSGGTISGHYADGVYLLGGTILNSGVIAGGTDAVQFEAGQTGRLVVYPGAVFTGLVDGGNTLGATAVSILELASGASAGTLNGLGASIVHFADINVDAGALWRLQGDALGAGYGIDVTGTLVNQTGSLGSVVTLATGASFRNLVGAAVSNGALSNGHQGVVYGGGAGVTIINNGAITDTGTSGDGIALLHGGTVSNGGTAAISGAFIGVFVTAAAGIVTNTGTILGSNNNGVALYNGGTITNTAGLIQGYNGVGVAALPGFISNAGTMIGTGRQGAGLGAGGSIYNSGLIEGVTGVYLAGVGTVTNAGSISASSNAVVFAGGHVGDRLIVDPGAAFTGVVNGGNKLGATVASTLELASGASVGTLSGIGSQFVDFGSIGLDASASWKVNGGVPSGETIAFASGADLQFANPGSVVGSVISFAPGETIDLVGVNPTSVSFASGSLNFAGGSFPLSFSGGVIHAATSSDGAAVTVACFREGTRIATLRGDVAVEALAVGESVRLTRGRLAAVEWIGHRHIDCVRHPAPESVWPVRITAGAFEAGRPTRDLWLSPDHAVLVDGVLIPVKHLINGTTMAQVMVRKVTYYHVELPRHDVMLAEGLAVESYLDTGDRANFSNGGGAIALHPDMASRVWEAKGCVPLVVAGPVLAAVRRRLARRAGRVRRAA
jgi:Hint domain